MSFLSRKSFPSLDYFKAASLRHAVLTELTTSADIFLSHSSRDADKLDSVAQLFDKYGKKIYVDRNDIELPEQTSPATAALLKKRIDGIGRLVALVTDSSRRSVWMPWELGLAHAAHGRVYAAVLPFSDDGSEGTWASQEYLGLYPRIYRHDSDDTWHVLDPADGKTWELSHWLNRVLMDTA